MTSSWKESSSGPWNVVIEYGGSVLKDGHDVTPERRPHSGHHRRRHHHRSRSERHRPHSPYHRGKPRHSPKPGQPHSSKLDQPHSPKLGRPHSLEEGKQSGLNRSHTHMSRRENDHKEGTAFFTVKENGTGGGSPASNKLPSYKDRDYQTYIKEDGECSDDDLVETCSQMALEDGASSHDDIDDIDSAPPKLQEKSSSRDKRRHLPTEHETETSSCDLVGDEIVTSHSRSNQKHQRPVAIADREDVRQQNLFYRKFLNGYKTGSVFDNFEKLW